MSVVVQARIDEKIKDEAALVLDEMGLTVSEAFRLLLVKTAKEKTLPFEIWRPNAKTLSAIEELQNGGGKHHADVDSLLADLCDDEDD